MKYPENRMTFTVNEVSKTCGISRTTLIRMEECGFLKPYYIDSDSGYRYYDADNIAQIGQYQLFMEFGLSRKEATELYYNWGQLDTKELLNRQKLRINRLQRLLHELEVRFERTNDFSFSYVEIPETSCFCVQCDITSIGEIETLAYDSFQSMVKEGFCVNGSESQFILMRDAQHDSFIYCVPIISSNLADPRVQNFPACHAISIIAHGDYSIIPALAEYSRAVVSSRKLKVTGQERLIALTAPYVGEHINPDDYCYEYVIPVENDIQPVIHNEENTSEHLQNKPY